MNRIYILKSVTGYYFDFDYEPNFSKSTLGTTYEDFQNNKVIPLSEDQVKFHNENPTASIKEVLNMKLEEKEIPTPSLDEIKHRKLRELYRHDSSDNVNQFLVNGELKAWFTPEERSNYKNSVEAAKVLKQPTLSIFISDTLLNIPTDKAEMILAMIQRYADECYINTKQHELNISSLETIEEVEAYDITTGYPEKLDFSV